MLVLKMSVNGIVGPTLIHEILQASVNLNLNWSKFNSLRANPADPSNPLMILYKQQNLFLRLTGLTGNAI
jgi:hypothetical protein